MVEEPDRNLEEGKGRKRLIILLLLILIIGAGGIGYYLWNIKAIKKKVAVSTANHTTVEKPQLPPDLNDLAKPGIFVSLGDFIVNLADTDVQRFVKLSITLEVVNEDVQNQVIHYLPPLRDAVVNLISSKYYRDIKTPEGKERLKIELLKRLNAILPEGGIKAVYFTSFVVQTM